MAPPEYGSTDYGTHHDEEEALRKLTKALSTVATDTNADCDEECCNNNKNNNNKGPTNEYVLNVAFISFVGFMTVQAFFAVIANIQSMLADTEAMGVDALTYLFNMCAERIKNRDPTSAELQLPLAVREHRIEMKRLYLELIPPLISVTTLIIVTIRAVREACETLFGETEAEEEDVSAGLMLFFSSLNLVLDMVNVTCFARAHQAYGLQSNHLDECRPHYNRSGEKAQLLAADDDIQGAAIPDHETHDSLFERMFGRVNLNMCSAWTHICADTMRSTAVLVAAAIAFLFEPVSPATADSCAAIAVSITILLSLIPLIRGLVVTARQIVIESQNKPTMET